MKGGGNGYGHDAHAHQGFPELDSAYQFLVTHAAGDREGVQACADLLRTMGGVFQSRASYIREAARLTMESRQVLEENKRLKNQMLGLTQQLTTTKTALERSTRTASREPFVLHKHEKGGKGFHTNAVHSVAIAHECQGIGTCMATASWDGSVKIVDYQLQSTGYDSVKATYDRFGTSKEIAMGGLYAVAFAKATPDILGCTSCDKNVYLWNTKKRECIAVLKGHTDEVNGIDFHVKQQVMCTASDDMKVIIWDYQEGIILRTLDKHTKAVYGTTFLDQEHQYLVATCCFDRRTRIFDMRDKNIVQTLEGHQDDVIGISYSSSQRLLATGSDDGMIITYDTRTWTTSTIYNTKSNPDLAENEVKRIAFSPDGDLLAAACSANVVMVYDVARSGDEPLAILGGHEDYVFDVAWATPATGPYEGKRFLVSASHDQSSMVWRENFM